MGQRGISIGFLRLANLQFVPFCDVEKVTV